MPVPKTPWPHAPTHQLALGGTFFVSASTLHKLNHFRGAKRLSVLHRGLLTVARDFGWQLEAWAVFSNHYHFVGHSPIAADDATSVSSMLKVLHVKTSGWLNKLDATPARQVWFNFRETRLTYQRSYFSRLNYTHQNPVKHGLVPVAISIRGVLRHGSSVPLHRPRSKVSTGSSPIDCKCPMTTSQQMNGSP